MKKLIILMLSLAFCLSLASCGESTGGNLKTKDFVVDYDYGMHKEGLATPLLDDSKPFFDLEDWKIDTLIAGDVITVRYKGTMAIQESYPSTVVTKDMNIVSIFLTKAGIMELTVIEGKGGKPVLKATNSSLTPFFDTDKIMIVNEDLTFRELNASDIGATLWGSYREATGASDAEIMSLYSYRPR